MSEREVRPFRTPWGEGSLTVERGRPIDIELPMPQGSLPAADDPTSAGRAASSAPSAPKDGAGFWVEQLEGFFAGRRQAWTAEDIGLAEMPISAFTRDVYRALLEVPPGETVGYGELARLAGHPGAARAVGSAMAANPLSLLIPCHRVVRSDGSTGRYGRCDALKPYLLALEGVH
jgi:methylated-DNA-[protein]-cysteine S-methyltransferase